jgi:CBS domain-containing protein/sporulation protein YlmC with PRC-barrel domain
MALSELLGRPVRDLDGALLGTARDFVVLPGEDPTTIAFVIVRSGARDSAVAAASLTSLAGGAVRVRGERTPIEHLPPEGLLLLRRDLLDQQIIDVLGRKVVRVNDVDLDVQSVNSHLNLRLLAVEVGARGAVRRLAQGLVPGHALRRLLPRVPTRAIPWQFVDLIESDPARRLKLKIAYEGLSSLHPADIADIVEDLAPQEREAVFETLDSEVAASALEELDPKVKVAVVESLDSDRAADIVEEMNPDAAADLLGDLREEHTGAILKEMEQPERQQISQLLEFGERTAAGRMTTEFLAVPSGSTIDRVIEAMRGFTGGTEAVSTVYLTGTGGELIGAVPLSRIVTAPHATSLRTLATHVLVSCAMDTPDGEVAELFDKYNLLTLPVVDEQGRLAGIITADDVISWLRGES